MDLCVRASLPRLHGGAARKGVLGGVGVALHSYFTAYYNGDGSSGFLGSEEEDEMRGSGLSVVGCGLMLGC